MTATPLSLDDRLARLEMALADITDRHPIPPADTPIDLHWPPPRTTAPEPTLPAFDPPADLLAAIPDPAFAVDADGHTAAWTPAAVERFGWPAFAVLGSAPPLLPADELPAYHRLLAQARAGVRVRDALLWVQDQSGRRVPAAVSAGPDGSGLVVFVLRTAPTEEPPTAAAVTEPATAAAVRDLAAVLADIGGTADRLVNRLPVWEPAREAAELVRAAVRRAAELADVALNPPPAPALPDAGPVLLVDDDDDCREAARTALAGAGYRVLEAITGDDAWRRAKAVRGPLPLLVTDLALPGLSGRMLADWLRATRPGLRVVFTCGYRPPTEELPAGMTVLAKPFRPDQLLAAVRRVRAAAVV